MIKKFFVFNFSALIIPLIIFGYENHQVVKANQIVKNIPYDMGAMHKTVMKTSKYLSCVASPKKKIKSSGSCCECGFEDYCENWPNTCASSSGCTIEYWDCPACPTP